MKKGATFRSAIPTQIVSNEEFRPFGQTAEQVRVEQVVAGLVERTAASRGLTRREFFETTGGLGGVLADAVTYGLPLTEVETYPGRVRATTPEGVMAAARGFSADDAVVVVVGQADMFIDALRAQHPDVVVIPAADLDLNSPTLGLMQTRAAGAQ